MDEHTMDRDIYDDEAYLGNEEGEILDGEVVDDLNEDDEDDLEEEEDDDEDAAKQYGEPGTTGQMEGIDEERPERPDDSTAILERHAEAVVAVAWSPVHADAIATGSCDDSACIWRLGAEGEARGVELKGHEDTVSCLEYDPSGERVATGGMDGTVRVWDASTGAQVAALEGAGEAIEWLAWHPRGTVLLAGSEDYTTWMWNTTAQTCMQVFTGHTGPVVAGGFTPDGRTVVTGGGEGDGSLRFWNPKSGECTSVIAPGHTFHAATGVTCLAFSPDGTTVATGGIDGAVVVSSVASGKAVAKMVVKHTDSVEGIAFSALGLLVSTGLDGAAIVWDLSANTERARCEHPEGCSALAMQRSGVAFATGCLDGAVRVWDVRSAQVLADWGGHRAAVQSVTWSPDELRVLSGSDDCTARVFELPGDAGGGVGRGVLL